MEENIINNNPDEYKQKAPFTVRESDPDNEKRFSSRASTSRKTRIEDERPPIVFGGGSRFNLSEKVLNKIRDSGKVLGFVVYSINNENQRENFFNALDRGWKPLDAREFPELTRQYELSPFGKTEEDYLIRRGGQIAMVRDKDIDDAERDYYDSEKRRQEDMAAAYAQRDPRLPKPFMDERRRERIRV